MLVDRTDIVNNVPMSDGNVRVAIETEKDRPSSERLARVGGVADGGNGVDCGAPPKGGRSLSVRLQVLVGVTRGVRRRATSAPRLRVGFGFLPIVLRGPLKPLPSSLCRSEVRIGGDRKSGIAAPKR